MPKFQKWPQDAEGWRNAILTVLIAGTLSADLLIYLGGTYQNQLGWAGFRPYAGVRFWNQIMEYMFGCSFVGLVIIFVVSLIFWALYKDKLALCCIVLSPFVLFSLFVILAFSTRAIEKPVIYLYPTTEEKVNVKLKYKGQLACTYPEYPDDGWTVIAQPSGDLLDLRTGKRHYCLFWEGVDNFDYTVDEGFVVKGEDTAQFLESTLSLLGLSDREKNEFIIYWLPRMQEHPYNLVSFVSDQFAQQAQLEITPPPETLIRVFMVFKPLNAETNVKLQVLKPVTRRGFTVVEWGGSEL